ncbi:MAG: hypothetical protein EKK40_13845 [Bradyrhizobiaceae bacterium]|nr:MAG: hypothetical protein EKK40_13845 [Bradyrhizobiaceae bacterium]
MEWTTTSLIIQIVAGFFGAHIAAIVSHEHRFGFVGHSLVGLIAGGLSGWFFQTRAVTMVTASGSLNAVSQPEVFALQGLSGAIMGAIAMFCVGFILAERRASQEQSRPE